MDLIGQGFVNLFFRIYSFIFLPLLVKLSDKIIISTFDYLKHSKIEKYFKKYPTKFIKIPLGVNLEKFCPRKKDKKLLEKYKINPETQLILFVGNLDRAHYFKGLDILLQAISKLKRSFLNFKLIIVGEGNLRAKYEKIAKKLKIDDKVIFVGRVSGQKLPNFYNLADIFVFPSITKSEAFGLVLLEAMACGCPILVSNLPGPRMLVKENINGLLVKPKDVNDLAKKLKFLLENKEISQYWGKNSRKIVEEKYNWSIVGERIEKLFQKISVFTS